MASIENRGIGVLTGEALQEHVYLLRNALKGLLRLCFRVVSKVVSIALKPLFLILEFSCPLAALPVGQLYSWIGEHLSQGFHVVIQLLQLLLSRCILVAQGV